MISSTPPWLWVTHVSSFTMPGSVLRWRVPGALEERLQDSILVAGSELFLVDHLRDHLLSNAFQGRLFTVKNHHTCWKVTESSVTFGVTGKERQHVCLTSTKIQITQKPSA